MGAIDDEMKRGKKKGKAKVRVVMSEFKRGELHSGSGDVVKDRKQAVAIAMSESGMSKRMDKEMRRKGK